MKKIIALLFICAPIAIVFMACNDWSQSSSDLGKDYMSNLKEHIVIQKPTAVIACEKETLLKTRSQETVVYTITAKSKEDLEKKQDESMVWDVACEWLPCKTANAIMSGLYCMGLK